MARTESHSQPLVQNKTGKLGAYLNFKFLSWEVGSAKKDREGECSCADNSVCHCPKFIKIAGYQEEKSFLT